MDLLSSQTLAEALKKASVFLEKEGHDHSLARMYWLYTFDWDLTQCVRQLREPVTVTQLRRYQEVLERIVQNEPIQYILGYADFMGERFKVTSDTLIPREDTAGLVQLAWNYLSTHHTARVLDIGTGTGIIAIQLSKLFPKAHIVGVDISETALEVAKLNQLTHKTHVEWQQSDVYDALPKKRKFHLIVSNPPYISEDEQYLMDESVLKYEPHLALFADKKGLALYERIVSQAVNYLEEDGMLLLEIGFRQGEVVKELCQEYFPTAMIEVHQDLNGQNRYVVVDLRKGVTKDDE